MLNTAPHRPKVHKNSNLSRTAHHVAVDQDHVAQTTLKMLVDLCYFLNFIQQMIISPLLRQSLRLMKVFVNQKMLHCLHRSLPQTAIEYQITTYSSVLTAA